MRVVKRSSSDPHPRSTSRPRRPFVRRAARLLAVAGIVAAGLAAPASAHGDSAPAGRGAPQPKAGRHCVVHLSRADQVSCFSSFTAAISSATGGKITDAPADARSALNDPRFAARLDETAAKHPSSTASSTRPTAAQGSTVIGIEYWHIGWAGSTYVLSADYGCTTALDGPEWEFSFWRAPWSDNISSFRTYANCYADHFDGPFYTGDHTGYQYGQYYIGEFMNDRTSSIQWS
ncbi:hypothetical protein ABZZ79_34800 [Streptomyces sp. NPDC006458]|uniref:hypothetical protein n=1 Tax=Streptomyces sp. NPDC006458 TaxID=3154302 RepID=UPI0033A1F0AB